MAANQRKKRENAVNLVGCISREQYRVNRKKLRVHKVGGDMRPNISLEWNNKKKSVVSKRDQIGIARRHLISFLGSLGHSVLADVCAVPNEIFEFENLSEVLSYEVWQTNFSDDERSFLSKFLPKVPEPDEGSFLSKFLPKVPEPDRIVRELLAGENFQFGNAFVKWGSSLCCGELHPDNILREEQSIKAAKKAYYMDLRKYHSGMIENLEKWKEEWASCKNPEVEIVQALWRQHDERNAPFLETKFHGGEENHVTTPESCSWTNSEVAYSSDNQNLGTVRGKSQRGGLKVGTSVSGKGEHQHERNIKHSDGAKYMSYIKVSREQHARIKSSMKHASNSIHPRSLNNVLGIDALNIQPYERFVEEEEKKLHQHWVKLATADIPEGFAYWVERQLRRKRLAQSLNEEIGQKLELQTTLDEEKEGSQMVQMNLSDNSEDEFLHSVTAEDVGKEQSYNLLQKPDNEDAVDVMEIKAEEVESDYIYDEQMHDDSTMTGAQDIPSEVFIEDINQQLIASLNNSPRTTSPSRAMFLQKTCSLNNSNNPHDDNTSAKTDEDASIVSEYPVEEPPSSCGNIWPVGYVHGSYFHESTNAGYAPAAAAQKLSLGKHSPQFMPEEEVTLLDDLGIESQDKDGGGGGSGSDMPLFDSYSNLNREEIYYSLRNLVYHRQQKRSRGLGFQPPGNTNMMMEAFAGQFRDQVYPTPLPLDLRQKRPNDNHLYPRHHNIQESSIYSGGRFAVPRQAEGLPENIMQHWTAVSSNMRLQQQQQGQSWFNGDDDNNNDTSNSGTTRDGWPCPLEVAVNGHLSCSSVRNSDETLFSVLSECNELPPRGGASWVGQQVIHAGNYTGGSTNGGGIIDGGSSGFLQQSTAEPSSYYYGGGGGGGLEAAGIMMNNVVGMGWMGMPQQNSGLHNHDPLSKSFLGSWNQ